MNDGDTNSSPAINSGSGSLKSSDRLQRLADFAFFRAWTQLLNETGTKWEIATKGKATWGGIGHRSHLTLEIDDLAYCEHLLLTHLPIFSSSAEGVRAVLDIIRNDVSNMPTDVPEPIQMMFGFPRIWERVPELVAAIQSLREKRLLSPVAVGELKSYLLYLLYHIEAFLGTTKLEAEVRHWLHPSRRLGLELPDGFEQSAIDLARSQVARLRDQVNLLAG